MSTVAILENHTHTPIPKYKGGSLMGGLPELSKDPLNFFMKLMSLGDDIIEFSVPFDSLALVLDADMTHQILVKDIEHFPKATRDTKIMGTVLGKGLVTNNQFSHHKTQRKLVQPGFHFRRIQGYADTMLSYTQQLTKDWTSGTRHISDDMFELTLYIVCKTLFDINMEGLSSEANKIGQIMSVVQEGTNKRFSQVLLFPDWLPTPNNLKLLKARRELDEIIQEMIEQKRIINSSQHNPQRYVDNGDMMSMLLNATYEDGSVMDRTQLMDELITLFTAGHETTSNTLTWTFHLLSRHPEIQEKLFGEVDNVFVSDSVTLDEIKQLTYTEMVIKESMRLYPPAWTLSPREASKDIVVGEYLIPKGKQIFSSPYVNHRNPRYFANPDMFNPERFSPENEKLIPKHIYIPFGTGPRICIGQSFAMMEAKIILASIIKRFRIRPGSTKEIESLPQITMSVKGGLDVMLEARDQ